MNDEELEDNFLRHLLEEAKDTENERVNITVSIHGVLITGEIGTSEDYLAAYSKMRVPKASESCQASNLKNLKGAIDDILRPESFLHLKKATVVHPGGAGGETWWRIRLTEIEAFSLNEPRSAE